MLKNIQLPYSIFYRYPKNDEVTMLSCISAGEQWQIYKTDDDYHALIVEEELLNFWHDNKLIEKQLFTSFTLEEKTYYSLLSKLEYFLEPSQNLSAPLSKVDALSFATSINETRKIFPTASLFESIYVEQYSRLLPTLNSGKNITDNELLRKYIINNNSVASSYFSVDDIIKIFKIIGEEAPSSLLVKNISTKTPDSSGEIFLLPGRPRLEKFFNDHVIDILNNLKNYQELGVQFPSAVILHGPPGCGKTYAVEKLIKFIGWRSYSIDSNSIGSPFIHETSKKISEVFNNAIENAPSIIVIDEMESFLTNRQSNKSNGTSHVEEVAEFLRYIPKAISNNVLIIAMTNVISMIDPAILRRGRFDHIIEVGMPSHEEVKCLLESLLTKVKVDENLEISKSISLLTGRPLSDVAFFIKEAGRLAAKERKKIIDQASFDMALESVFLR